MDKLLVFTGVSNAEHYSTVYSSAGSTGTTTNTSYCYGSVLFIHALLSPNSSVPFLSCHDLRNLFAPYFRLD